MTIKYLCKICVIEVGHIKGVLEGLVDEGWAVVPGHGLLKKKCLGQNLLRA